MNPMKNLLLLSMSLFLAWGCNAQTKTEKKDMTEYKVQKSDEEWRKELSPEQYYILREKGTERPGTGEYNLHFEDGVYKCAACNAPLFESDSKFESHCGWPSFDKAISENSVVEKKDYSFGMVRTEILCGTCGGHLGHVFDDGPTETGMRYCINSAALGFKKESESEK